VAELPWYRWIWTGWPAAHRGAFDRPWPLVEELLGRMREHGTLLPRDVGARETIDWYWRPTNRVRAILEALAEVGTIGIAGATATLRVYDLAERLFPAEILWSAGPREQQQHRCSPGTAATACSAHRATRSCGSVDRLLGGSRGAAGRARRAGRLIPVQVEAQGRALRRPTTRPTSTRPRARSRQ
jgi:uncharacterized protein YcaQ